MMADRFSPSTCSEILSKKLRYSTDNRSAYNKIIFYNTVSNGTKNNPLQRGLQQGEADKNT
jgi:hypothetical protein